MQRRSPEIARNRDARRPETTGIILGVTAFTIAIAATSVAYATQTVDGKLDDVTGRYQTGYGANYLITHYEPGY